MFFMSEVMSVFLPSITVREGAIVSCNALFLSAASLEKSQVVGADPSSLITVVNSDKSESSFDHFLCSKEMCTSQNFQQVYITDVNHFKLTGMVHCQCDREDNKAYHLFFKLDNDKSFDAITGLRNGWAVSARAAHYYKTDQNIAHNLSLILVNVDNFSTINFRYGYSTGDDYLHTLANHLKAISPDNDLVVRLSNAKFGVLVYNHESLQKEAFQSHVLSICDAFCELSLCPITLPNGIKITKTLSLGVNAFNHRYDDYFSMELAAEDALKLAEKLSYSQYCIASAVGNNNLLRDKLIIDALPKAIRENQIEIFYQPQYCLKTDSLIGFEALSRWEHKSLGPVRPDVFVKIAEEIGLHLEFDLWVFKQVCIQITVWLNSDKIEFLPRTAINFSFKTLETNLFSERIAVILKETGCPTDKIEIEVTETASINFLDTLRKNVLQIKRMGIHIAVDDFGSGYSSLSLIRTLRPSLNKLKIDRSLISNITSSNIDKEFARKIVELCQTLRIKVLAEGIETKAQEHILKELGCNYSQGYLYSKAMNKSDTTKLLESY